MKNIKLKFIIIFFISIGAIYYVSEQDKQERIQIVVDKSLYNLELHYKILLKNQYKIADLVYKSTIKLIPEVIDIMAKVQNASKEEKDILRKKLYNKLKIKYELLKVRGVLQYHFILPNNKSFLRMHKPDKYGDDLTNIREDIERVNKTHKIIRGLAQGRTAHGFRNIYPIFTKEGKYLGAMGVAFSSDTFQKHLTQISKIHTHFIIDKKIFDTKRWDRDDMIIKYAQSSEHKNYMMALSKEYTKEICIKENKKSLKHIKNDIEEKMQKGLKFSLYTNIHLCYGDIVSFLPVKDISGKQILAWFVTYEKSDFISSTIKNTCNTRIFLFILLLLLFYFIYQTQMQVKNEIEKNKKLNNLQAEIEVLNITLENRIKLALYDLHNAQKIAKIGYWQYKINQNIFILDDMAYSIFDIDKNKYPNLTIQNYLDMVHIDDGFPFFKAYDKHLVKKIPYRLIHKIITYKGKIKYIEERCETTFDNDDHPLISKGTVQDVTEQYEAQLLLKQKDQQMIDQSRLAQMGEMISMIAHQWRQPLSSITAVVNKLMFKLMMEDNLDKQLCQDKLEKIIQYSTHLSNTIDDFRTFFKANKKKELSSLTKIVDSTLNIIKVSIENRNISLNIDLNCDIEFETYSNEVKQVLLNIIKNAEDALLENKIQNPSISIKTYTQIPNNPTLIIKDNAGGIPDNVIDKIFDPYFSTKKAKDGTGLGLYMSKTIIEDHCGGKISALNDKDGVVFKIEFNPKQIKFSKGRNV